MDPFFLSKVALVTKSASSSIHDNALHLGGDCGVLTTTTKWCVCVCIKRDKNNDWTLHRKVVRVIDGHASF